MALANDLQFAKGVIHWLSTDPLSTTYVISGLSFRPKAFKFYWLGHQSSVNGSTNSSDSRRGIGFASGPSAQRCVVNHNIDAAATITCTTGHYSDCVVATVSDTGPARDGALALDSVQDDGFTVIVTDVPPVSLTIGYEVWGGDGVTATVGDITEPAAIGPQDYSADGFVPESRMNQVVHFAGTHVTAADSAVRSDSGLCIGIATGVDPQRNIVVAVNSQDNVASTNSRRMAESGTCLALLDTGTDVTARAHVSAFLTNGFRLEWLERGVTDRRYIYLAIRGGRWQTGEFIVNASAVGNTAVISDLPFTLIGVSCVAHMSTATRNTSDVLTMGSATSASDRQGMSHFDENGTGAANIELGIWYDQILPFTVFFAELNRDISVFGTDSFTIRWDGPVTEGILHWGGYLAFGPDRRFLLH